MFRHVKMPFLAPAFTYNITVTVIGAMSAFDIVIGCPLIRRTSTAPLPSP